MSSDGSAVYLTVNKFSDILGKIIPLSPPPTPHMCGVGVGGLG